ncbi:hypothetical protein [Algivirga pacifica]|uniref:Uncharacterized protein n=1 Tax=Algivirga pacifica TaxID=1162670 RepID=A0ABP9DJT9_9BACT
MKKVFSGIIVLYMSLFLSNMTMGQEVVKHDASELELLKASVQTKLQMQMNWFKNHFDLTPAEEADVKQLGDATLEKALEIKKSDLPYKKAMKELEKWRKKRDQQLKDIFESDHFHYYRNRVKDAGLGYEENLERKKQEMERQGRSKKEIEEKVYLDEEGHLRNEVINHMLGLY